MVSKDELLAALWPDVRVGGGVLKTCIWEIRQALRDQPQAPRFIETLPRRGYRFINPLSGDVHTGHNGQSPALPMTPLLQMAEPHAPTGMVGREVELALLR